MAPRALDTASISFGLVSIPVKVFASQSHAERLSSHYLHAACGTRLKQQLFCPKDQEIIPRSEVVRGYEVEPKRYVALTAEEIKGTVLDTEQIDIGEFVPLAKVDLLSYDTAYFLGPATKAAGPAYGLLFAALRESELVAIGEYVARGREDLIMLRAGAHALVMHRLRRPEEIHAEGSVVKESARKPTKAELGLAREMIGKLARDDFDPSRYQDDSRARLRTLIAEQRKRRGTTGDDEGEVPEAPTGKVLDLMSALRESLAVAGKPAGRGGAPRGVTPRRRGAVAAGAAGRRTAKSGRPSRARGSSATTRRAGRKRA